MGIFEFIFITTAVFIFGIVSIPVYAMYRGYNQSDEKLKIQKMKEERALEELKQENYLLENKQMRIELDKIKSEKEEKRLEEPEESRWLIDETKSEGKS